MGKFFRVVLGFSAVCVGVLGAYCLADQVALMVYNQHLSWRLFAIPALTLLAGLGIGLGIGARLRGRVTTTWLSRGSIALFLLALAILFGSSGIFIQTSGATLASVEEPLNDIFSYQAAEERNVQPAMETESPERGQVTPAPVEEAKILDPEIISQARPFTDPQPDDVASAKSTGSGGNPQVERLVRLEIPKWDVGAGVVQVPFEEGAWDVSSIGNDVAQLGGINGEEILNNIVLAGHVTLPLQGFGPFRYLEKLRPGDQILVYSDGREFRYQVRERRFVPINEVSITYETPSKQLTLVTCTAWNEDDSTYDQRLVVFADLVGVGLPEQPISR